MTPHFFPYVGFCGVLFFKIMTKAKAIPIYAEEPNEWRNYMPIVALQMAIERYYIQEFVIPNIIDNQNKLSKENDGLTDRD
jgi:hypothetical protein